MADIIVAVDFGTTKVVMAAATKESDGRLNVLGFESKSINSGIVNNGIVMKPGECAGALLEVYKKMSNRLQDKNLNIKSAYASVGGRSMRSMLISKSFTFDQPTTITESVVDLLCEQGASIKLTGKEVFQFDVISYIIDGEEQTEPIGKVGTSITVNLMLIVGSKVIKENVNNVFDRLSAQILLEDLQFAPLAIAQAVVSKEDKQNGCCMINFGASTTDYVIYSEGRLVETGVVPFGSYHVTKDLMNLFQLRENEAEELKKSKGVALAERVVNENYKINSKTIEINSVQMAQVIQARIEEILNFIWVKIKNYQLEQNLHAGVIITGGGSKLKFLSDLISERFQMSVRNGITKPWLASDNHIELNSTEYAQIIGQLLLGTQNCVEEVVKPDIAEQHEEEDTKPKRNKKDKKGKSFTNLLGGLFDSTSSVEE